MEDSFVKIKNSFKRHLFTKDVRGASVLISLLAVVTKPVGFVKNLIVAWLFGASIFMDGFNMAVGILAFLAGLAPSALENAIFPALARARAGGGDEDRRLMVWTFWSVGLASLALSGALLLWGPGVVRFFAPGFDAPRVDSTVTMMWILLPYAVAVAIRSPMESWANHTEQFVLPQFSQSFASVIWITVMLLAYRWIGAYAVAVGMSAAALGSVGILAWAMFDFPWRLAPFPSWGLVRGMGRDFILCAALTEAGALYVVVDRYFASMLPVGDLTALSNGSSFYGVALGLATSPLLIFFARSSRIAAEENQGLAGEDLRGVSFVALAIGWTFALPPGLALSALSTPLLTLFLGHGAYKDAVGTTAACLSLYSIGFVASILSSTLYRLAQAGGMLWKVVMWSLGLVALNALLDWIMVWPLGVMGLALATALVTNVGLGIYVMEILPDFPRRFALWHPWAQTFLGALWGGALWILGNRTALWPEVVLILGAGALIGHWWFCERWGWLDYLPPRWRPSAFWDLGARRWRAWRIW